MDNFGKLGTYLTMKINEIHIHHFRNLAQVNIVPSRCNVILGNNGSGKTSILESIYLLSRGKSFRHHQPKHYISHGFAKTTVFAKLHNPINHQDETVAIEKSQDASTQLRHQGQTVATQSPITKLLPTILFEPNNLNVLEIGSQSRREILDWLVFHVEQDFFSNWVNYQHLLKQRNRLLKSSNLSPFYQQEIMAWDNQISHYASMIHQFRESILQQWQSHFDEQLNSFLPQYADKLRLRYSAGFDVSVGLAQTLAERLPADMEMGYTRMGCHRADMNVVLDFVQIDEQGQKQKRTLPAVDMLSRGEKKLLMMALRLSQLPLLNAMDKLPLVLLDDITAELDNGALATLLKGLKQVNSQLFITSLSDEIVPLIEEIWQDDIKLFHVEHGDIKPI